MICFHSSRLFFRMLNSSSILWRRFASSIARVEPAGVPSTRICVPVMAIFYAVQRHLVGGLTAGSVKG